MKNSKKSKPTQPCTMVLTATLEDKQCVCGSHKFNLYYLDDIKHYECAICGKEAL